MFLQSSGCTLSTCSVTLRVRTGISCRRLAYLGGFVEGFQEAYLIAHRDFLSPVKTTPLLRAETYQRLSS